jgi:hypothetical protein
LVKFLICPFFQLEKNVKTSCCQFHFFLFIFLVILGSVRPGRQGVKVGKLISNQLTKRENFSTVLIDPLEWDIPLTMPRKINPPK